MGNKEIYITYAYKNMQRCVMEYSLAKIANELGVSKATVSFVLNGKARQARISTEVEERIKKFCKEVNYVPNIHAQRINRKFVRNIGFLVNQSTKKDDFNPFADYNIGGIMGGIAITAESIGCRAAIQLYNSKMDESRVFDWLRNHEIDGLIYYGLDMPEKWIKTFADEKRCVAGIGIEPCENISSVNIDNYNCSKKLTEHLISTGRKNFVYMSGIDGSYVSDERKRGFIDACADYGIEIDKKRIVSAGFSESMAEKIVLEQKFDADAIICANDDMAIGVMKALKKLNIDIPSETAVAGGDDIGIGRYFSPSLTTFSNMQYELGASAVKCVIRMIKGKDTENIVLPGKVIVRESA